MDTLVTLISNPLITHITAALGVAFILFSKNCKVIRLIGFWFVAEAACDYLVNKGSIYFSYTDSTIYYYLYAATSLMFGWHVLKNRVMYPYILPYIFTCISILSVLFGILRYEMLTSWDEWGQSFYYSSNAMVDGTYLLSIVAVEAIMIYIGLKFAYSSTPLSDRLNSFYG